MDPQSPRAVSEFDFISRYGINVLRRMAITFAAGRHLEANQRLCLPGSMTLDYAFLAVRRDPPVSSRVLHFLKNL